MLVQYNSTLATSNLNRTNKSNKKPRRNRFSFLYEISSNDFFFYDYIFSYKSLMREVRKVGGEK